MKADSARWPSENGGACSSNGTAVQNMMNAPNSNA
jgi:hypothetical protein